MIISEYQGQGAGTWARLRLIDRAKAAGVKELFCYTRKDNIASNILNSRLGYKPTGKAINKQHELVAAHEDIEVLEFSLDLTS